MKKYLNSWMVSLVMIPFLAVSIAGISYAQSSRVIALSAGQQHSVAVKQNGTVWAWGYNAQGQLGDGTTDRRLNPVQVIDPNDPTGYLTGVTTVSSGTAWGLNVIGHTLALKQNGTVWGWGNGYEGQLGDGEQVLRSAPVQVEHTSDPTGYLTNVIAIGAGDVHSIAAKADGTVWAWGNNGNGQLGDGSTTRRLTAVQVTGLTGVVSVAAGENHSVALKQDGTVWAWGSNSYGQLGDSSWTQRTTPVQVVDPTDPSGRLTGVTAISAGGAFTLALKSDGTMRAWGYNLDGRLGDGTWGTGNWKNTPVRVVAPTDPTGYLTGIIAIACGDSHSMAVKQGGTVWTWGYNGRGQLGDGTKVNKNMPGQISGLSQVVAVEGGFGHSLAAKQDGTVWAWGGNWDGQLGDGTTDERLTPVLTLFPLEKERQLLEVRGPYFVTPGDTVTYLVQLDNILGSALEDAIVIFDLPRGFRYLSSTRNGIYRNDRHQVFWKLGRLNPGDVGTFSVKAEVPWGLPMHLDIALFADLAARNIESSINVDNYLNYVPVGIVSENTLTTSEINALLSGNRNLRDLFDYAITQGYVFDGVVEQTDFSNESSMLTFALLTPEGDGVAFLHKVGDGVFMQKYQGNTYSLFNKDGGNRWDGESGAFSAWGDWAEEGSAPGASRGRLGADSQAFSQCISVCVTQTVPAWNAYIRDDYTSSKKTFCLTCQAALQAGSRDPENCSACAQLYVNKHKLRIAEGEGGLLHGKAISKCFDDCDKPGTWKCAEGETYKLCNPSVFQLFEEIPILDHIARLQAVGVQTFRCQISGSGSRWVADKADWEECLHEEGEVCRDDPEPHCAVPCDAQETASLSMLAAPICELHLKRKRSKTVNAHDPNAKSADAKGDVIAGQRMNYTIEYENTGQGTAYGVFILDKLDGNLDETTMSINEGGTYSSASRLLSWDIGDVPAGGKGSVTFSVNIRSGLPSGTEITNAADIYFPSVPEITPTNAVVNVIKAIVAEPKAVEATSGTPAAITLTGKDSGNRPLTFSIVTPPLCGTITGTSPNISYTSMDEFSGQDEFYYVANNGIIDSYPAKVMIQVQPNSSDAKPPEVAETVPRAGSTNIHFSTTPLPTVPALYIPAITATFSEPVDASTVTADTFTVSGLSGVVSYDEIGWRAWFSPSTPLSASATYTAQLTTGIRDKVGNPLASVHTWQFTTESPANIAVLLPDGGEGVNFGQGYANMGSVDKVVSISSTGSVDLVLGTITIGGGDAGDFIRGTDTCSGKTLRQFEQCTVRVSFQPASLGAKNAQLSVPSNDPDTSLLNIALVGSAVAAPPILLQRPMEGDSFSSCSVLSLPTFGWITTGSFKSYQVEFSLDEQFGSVPVKVKVSGQNTQVTLASGSWKKVVLLAGPSGGTVYWRVIGTPADKTQTTARSNVDYFVIGAPDAVGGSRLAPINGASPPTLSWDNNCNTKFKAWFGTRADFTEPGVKKKGFSFSDSDPADAGGVFTTLLSAGQWASIKKLIAGEGSSTIYWYVESWDPLKRYQKTGVMQCVVTE